MATGVADFSIRQGSANQANTSSKGGPRLGNFNLLAPLSSEMASKMLAVMRNAMPWSIPFLLISPKLANATVFNRVTEYDLLINYPNGE